MLVYVYENDWSKFVNGDLIEVIDATDFQGVEIGMKKIIIMFHEIEEKLAGDRLIIRKKV